VNLNLGDCFGSFRPVAGGRALTIHKQTAWPSPFNHSTPGTLSNAKEKRRIDPSKKKKKQAF
jgi:hypothetical protein